MKQSRQTKVLAVATLLSVVGIGAARQAGWFASTETAPASPEEAIPAAIYTTLNAARSGDVRGFLAGHTGPMRAALQRSLDDTGAARFARYLQGMEAGVKGLALSVEISGEREAKARLEYVYQERNEVQEVYLEKEQGTWRIARTADDQPVKAAIAYGTPIR